MINGKYKRLVVYGCSFTAGDELADALVLGMTEDEVDLLKRSGMSRQELYGKLHNECIRAGKTLTWARWLADHYNVPYSNRARGGGSLQQMVYRIERDYHNGITHEDDLVIAPKPQNPKTPVNIVNLINYRKYEIVAEFYPYSQSRL